MYHDIFRYSTRSSPVDCHASSLSMTACLLSLSMVHARSTLYMPDLTRFQSSDGHSVCTFSSLHTHTLIHSPVSPYLKSLSMVTCARLMHLMESFSTQWFLFAKPTNHYLVFYLLEIFNNIIQYQFDGRRVKYRTHLYETVIWCAIQRISSSNQYR